MYWRNTFQQYLDHVSFSSNIVFLFHYIIFSSYASSTSLYFIQIQHHVITDLVKQLSLKTNPRTAYFVSLWVYIITILGTSAYILLEIKSMSMLFIIFGLNGLCQGMFLCVETMIFSILVPEGRESVMSG